MISSYNSWIIWPIYRLLTVKAYKASLSCGDCILCAISRTDISGPSSSLFIWSQNALIYSQSTSLFAGFVALSTQIKILQFLKQQFLLLFYEALLKDGNREEPVSLVQAKISVYQ